MTTTALKVGDRVRVNERLGVVEIVDDWDNFQPCGIRFQNADHIEWPVISRIEKYTKYTPADVAELVAAVRAYRKNVWADCDQGDSLDAALSRFPEDGE